MTIKRSLTGDALAMFGPFLFNPMVSSEPGIEKRSARRFGPCRPCSCIGLSRYGVNLLSDFDIRILERETCGTPNGPFMGAVGGADDLVGSPQGDSPDRGLCRMEFVIPFPLEPLCDGLAASQGYQTPEDNPPTRFSFNRVSCHSQ